MVIEHGPPVLESSTRVSKFYAFTDFEYKFHKAGITNCLPIGFGFGSLLIGNLQL